MRPPVMINKLLRPLGIQINRFPSQDVRRRMTVIRLFEINLLIDVGANTGQYASDMRAFGYRGRIVSVEPLEKAFRYLQWVSRNDSNWTVNHFALGQENSSGVIHVSANSVSSSILDMLPSHEKSAPGSGYISKEKIEIRTLDSLFNTWYGKDDRVLLKIDTQGYEKQVLEGALEALRYIKIVQVEMSLVPLYQSGWLYQEVIAFMKGSGFELFSLENGFADEETGRLLQIDGLFVNTQN